MGVDAMKTALGILLLIGQYACLILAFAVSAYLLYRWNLARDADPATANPFNPWWPGVALAALSGLFKLARKGLASESKTTNRK